MLKSDEITLKLSEHRSAHNELANTRLADDATEVDQTEHRAKLDGSIKKLGELEAEFRGAITAEEKSVEDAHALRVAGGVGSNEPPVEVREYLELEKRADFGRFLESSLSAEPVEGAEAELRSAVVKSCGTAGYENVVPWAMLIEPNRLRAIRDEQLEKRAVVTSPSDIGAFQDPIIQDVFAASSMAFLRTRFQSASVGDNLEYVLTSTGATVVAKSADTTYAGSLASTEMTPHRLTAGYDFQVEQLARIKGLESALRADLPRALADALDKAYLTDDLSGSILDSYTITAATATVTWASGVETMASGIDGKYARDMNELKLLVGVKALRKFWGLFRGNSSDYSLAQYLKMVSGGIMASANLPDGDTQEAIVCKTGPGMSDNAVGKVWGGGVRIIRDEVTEAGKGRVKITARALYDFAVLRTAGFVGVSFKTT